MKKTRNFGKKQYRLHKIAKHACTVALPPSAWKLKPARKRKRVSRKKKLSRKPKQRTPAREKPTRRRKPRRRESRPRLPSPKVTPRPRRPRDPQKALQALADRYTKKHGLPHVVVRVAPGGIGQASYLHTQWKAEGQGRATLYGVPTIKIRAAEWKHGKIGRLQVEGTLYHELGHMREKWLTYRRYGYMPTAEVVPSRDKLPEEREAWKYARPHLTHPVQHWRRRLGMATHLKQVRYTGDPEHPFVHRTAGLLPGEARRFVERFMAGQLKKGKS